VRLDYLEALREFPRHAEAAQAATQAVLDVLPVAELSALARRSPGLRGFDWQAYIRLSALRMVQVGDALDRAGVRAGRLLDFGSYFGNFSLFARRMGFNVEAADNYGDYGSAFDPFVAILRNAGVDLVDLGAGRDRLDELVPGSYDAVLLLGVIEHIAHTPRPLLLALNRLLRRGGVLVVETPNLAYAYKREALAAGQSVFAPIESQFPVEPPFEGHHREYTRGEILWMLDAIGHEPVHVSMYNYSLYGSAELTGRDARLFGQMRDDADKRELILTASRRRP
jgi:2-polyprenyl-3-methyl-5-hydroxy-6-metoxy-1,4-benzoquinol methylase